MPNKEILCYISSWGHGSLLVYSLVGGLAPGSSGSMVGWYCSSSYEVAKPFSSFSPFSNSSIGNLVLSPMVGCKHLPLYWSGSGRASQETAISGSCQPALTSWHPKWWLLYMGWIPGWGWGSLWMAFLSVSAPHSVSVTPPMGILFPFLRRSEVCTL